MLFNSYVFILAFLPVFLIAFYKLREMANSDSKYRDACKWLIVVVSLVFYTPFGVRNLLVLTGSVVINALLAWSQRSQRGRFSLLWITVIINIVALLFFKFNGVFFPIAVSFYIF